MDVKRFERMRLVFEWMVIFMCDNSQIRIWSERLWMEVIGSRYGKYGNIY
jgi:hypothetical protein